MNDTTHPKDGQNGDFASPHQVHEPEMRFGVLWEGLDVDSGRVKEGQSLSHILDAYKFGSGKVATLAANAKDVYDVRKMRANRRWWIASTADSLNIPAWLIYERNDIDYVVFSLGDTLGAQLGSYPVDTLYRRVQGKISRSLYLDLEALDAPTSLSISMAGVYAWTIDFTHVQKGDIFDVYYFRKMANGKVSRGLPLVRCVRERSRCCLTAKQLQVFHFQNR